MSNNDLAYREAKRLAECIWRQEFKSDAPAWMVGETTEDIISQIDNMYAGLREKRDNLRFCLQQHHVGTMAMSANYPNSPLAEKTERLLK